MMDLPGERTVSAVATKRKAFFTKKRLVAIILCVMFGVIGLVFYINPGQKPEKEDPPPTQEIAQVVPYTRPPPEPMPLPAPAVMQNQLQGPPPASFAPPSPRDELPAPQKSLGERVVEAVGKQMPTHKPPRMLTFAIEEPQKTGSAGGTTQQDDRTSVTYKGSQIVGARAGAAIDKTFVLMPGIIQCFLDIAIDSTLPGPLMCHLEKPVISDNNVVLMEAGTRIMGSYTNELRQGQGRLMAVSAEAWTPNGVPVPLGGPFADGLGRSGMEGAVANHIIQRFGGAVLLSLVESALSIAQSSVSKGGNSYVSFSNGGVSTLAQEVLRSTINIPPTITKNQGEPVSIWVLKPIDFSQAYKLRSR